jgi:hypothetical protein
MSTDILAGYMRRREWAAAAGISDRTAARYENEPDGLPTMAFGGEKWVHVERSKDWLARRVKAANPQRHTRAKHSRGN